MDRRSYYRFLNAGGYEEEDDLASVIKEHQTLMNYACGYRNMHRWLRNEKGIRIGANRVLAIMRSLDVLSCVRRRKYTAEQYRIRKELLKNIPQNLLNRDFHADRPGQKYVSDITYLYGAGITKYLATIEDLYNGEIVAWKIGFHPDQVLCRECVDMLASRRDLRGAVMHSDEGSSYLALDYRFELKELGVIQSCSERGQCWDNAPMESFNGILKSEALYSRFKKSAVKNHRIPIGQIEKAVTDFIDYYNTVRPKEALGGKSPVSYRRKAFPDFD